MPAKAKNKTPDLQPPIPDPANQVGSPKPPPKRSHKIYVIVMLALAAGGLLLGQPWSPRPLPLQEGRAVLAYATDISAGGLLAGTNQHRAANGVGQLGINGQLAQAAQTKANDMATRNYWSHNTPEGNTPWTFVDATGYSYTAVAENLAYGFTTSSEVINGWKNSAGHNTNMLNGNYQDVGFGFANAANYQSSGPQTIVVAFYAHPTGGVAPPAPVAPTPPPPVVTPAPVTVPTPTPAAVPEPVETPATPVEPIPTPEPVAEPVTPPKAATPAPAKTTNLPAKNTKSVSRLQVLTAGRMPWISFGVGLLGSMTAAWLVLKHGLLLHKLIRESEKFVLKHTFLDVILMLFIIFCGFMSQTVGFVR